MTARPAVRWLAVAGLTWLLAGWVLGLCAVALGVWHLVRPPRPAWLLAGSVLLFTLVPVAWLAVNRHRFGQVTFALVQDEPAPHLLAAAALLLLVVGVVRGASAQLPARGVAAPAGSGQTVPMDDVP